MLGFISFFVGQLEPVLHLNFYILGVLMLRLNQK